MSYFTVRCMTLAGVPSSSVLSLRLDRADKWWPHEDPPFHRSRQKVLRPRFAFVMSG